MLYIKVPATSANLGPGFDTLGLALDLYNEITISPSHTTVNQIRWPQQEAIVNDEDNLVVAGIEAVFKYFDAVPVPYCLEMLACNIPISRGLGSSAAAYVAGITAGLYLLEKPLEKALICKIGSLLEGHPDNVAPAVFGGIVTAFIQDSEVYYQPVKPGDSLAFLALIPDVPLSTQKARAALPKVYDRHEVVFNLGRLSMLLTALINGNFHYLKTATQDKVHTPYRISLMPDSALLEPIAALDSCLGSFISGAGSTYMLMCAPDSLQQCMTGAQAILANASHQWELMPLTIQESGLSWEVLS